ncbi:MAG TPA: TolC family protein [Polyangiales bacterium]
MMRLSCGLSLCVWVAAVVQVQAQAQPSATLALPAEVRWSDVLPLVHQRSPRVQALRSQDATAQAEIGVAGVRPNPSLGYTGFARLGHGDNYGTQHQIGFEQPLWLAGQRSARVRSAEHRAQAVRAETLLSEAEIGRDALHAFVSLLATQARFDELTAARADVAAVSHTVHERVSAGAQSSYDEKRVDLESAQLDTRLSSASAELIDASTSFAQVLGLPGWKPRAVGTFEPLSIDANPETLWQQAQTALPALVAAQRHVDSARSEIDLARTERWGELTVSGGTFLTSDKGSVSAFLGVSAPLPLFNFGGAAIDRAQAGLAQTEAERAAARAEAQAALLGATAVLVARRTALAGYDSAVLQRLPELRKMAEDAYKSGKASLLELLDSVRSNIDVRLQRVDLVSAVMTAEVDVLAAAGLLQNK